MFKFKVAAYICILVDILIIILAEKLDNIIETDILNKILWGALITGGMAITYIISENRERSSSIKNKKIRNIFSSLFDNYSINAEKFVNKESYFNSNLFSEEVGTNFKGNELIEYEYKGVAVVESFLDVRYLYKRAKLFMKYKKLNTLITILTDYQGSKSGYIQFQGNFFINRFPKIIDYNETIIKFSKTDTNKNWIILMIVIDIILILFMTKAIHFLTQIFSLKEIIPIFLFILLLINFAIIDEKIEKWKSKNNIKVMGEKFKKYFTINNETKIAEQIFTEDLIDIIIKGYEKYKVETNISIKRNIVYIAFSTPKKLFSESTTFVSEKMYLEDSDIFKDIIKINNCIIDEITTIKESVINNSDYEMYI